MSILLLMGDPPKPGSTYDAGDVVAILEDDHVFGGKEIWPPFFKLYMPRKPTQPLLSVLDQPANGSDTAVRKRAKKVDLTQYTFVDGIATTNSAIPSMITKDPI